MGVGGGTEDTDQLIGVWEGQVRHEQGLEAAEHGGVDPDAEGEDEDGDGGEGGVFEQVPDGEGEVAFHGA